MLISLVVPAYNESPGINQFNETLLIPALKKIGCEYEIIYVNDGSSDSTLSKLTKLASKNKRIRVVNLSRNFGKEIATTAGISVSKGDATVILDADGQHPPEMISAFIEKWHRGAQVVVGVRQSNEKEGIVKRIGSILFYKLFNRYSGAEIIPRSTDFRLIDSNVREAFLLFQERNRITRGLIDWLGFKRDYVEFSSPARIAGEASYKTSQLFKLALNSFVSLSLKPLEVLVGTGVVITLMALCVGVIVFIEQILLNDPLKLAITGSAMLGIFITFLVGLVIMSQGVIAIYLAHIHTQTQDRPLFIIDHSSSVHLDD